MDVHDAFADDIDVIHIDTQAFCGRRELCSRPHKPVADREVPLNPSGTGDSEIVIVASKQINKIQAIRRQIQIGIEIREAQHTAARVLRAHQRGKTQ